MQVPRGIRFAQPSSRRMTVVQPDSAIAMIRSLYSIIPMVLMILLAVTAFFLGRLNKKMPEIEAKINGQNEKTEEVTE